MATFIIQETSYDFAKRRLLEKQALVSANIIAERTEATVLRDQYETCALCRLTIGNTDPTFGNDYYFLSLTKCIHK